MRWDNAGKVEECVWNMRLADLPRGEQRAILNRLYNGDPPFDPALAEQNNIEINRNDLEGVNLLAQARRQWYAAFLNTENYFTASLDSGPRHKRREKGAIFTRNANIVLREQPGMIEQIRSTGGNSILHGPGPCIWENRKKVMCKPIPVSSLLIPSETLVGFDNLAYFAVFREWTPAQLYELTHGPRVDPGWNMGLVRSQLAYVGEQTQKQPNATAFQYMPERIEELVKQDLGYWGSDAVPTIDAWDFYFREEEDGHGWYRRVILDWDITEGSTYERGKPIKRKNEDANGKFLYTSKNRKYANSLSEILHVQSADCSAVFPQMYHSQRSLGWMLWGICDLQNRLHCKFNEAVFEQLMWFFRVASNQDLMRIRKANFTHMGVVPVGIDWVKPEERYKPPLDVVQAAFARNQQLMNSSAASWNQQFDQGGGDREMTATEIMARTNQVNALTSGLLGLAYSYENFKAKEFVRRLQIKTKPDRIAAEFQKRCLAEGLDEADLFSEGWHVQCNRLLGMGNKTLGMAQAKFLLDIRKNLPPDSQRQVDHIAIAVNTDDPALAQELAPDTEANKPSSSTLDAQLVTDRLMRGLPFIPNPAMVPEDYIKVWVADLQLMVTRADKTQAFTEQDIIGWDTLIGETEKMLQILSQDDDNKAKVKGYNDKIAQSSNMIKKFIKILVQKKQNQNGNGGVPPKVLENMQANTIMANQKAKERAASHADKTAQRQVQFELEQQREDRRTNAAIARENAKAASQIAIERAKQPLASLSE